MAIEPAAGFLIALALTIQPQVGSPCDVRSGVAFFFSFVSLILA
jgi:hypothetical protein